MRCLLLCLIPGMIISLFACSPGEVTFPDPNLETVIRKAIDRPEGPIYTSDLKELTSLFAEKSKITNLTGLQSCRNLTHLLLSENEISDISPLASLTNLYALVLDENQISDISPLASLTNLKKLWLHNNQIEDISPLSSLTKLYKLWLGGNPLSNSSTDIYIPQFKDRGTDVHQ